jgi:hypothetical protein
MRFPSCLCACVSPAPIAAKQRGLLLDESMDWPWLSRTADLLLFLSLRRRLSIASVELLPNTSMRTEEGTFRESYLTGGVRPISSWWQAPWDSRPVFFFPTEHSGCSPYVKSPLMRGWVWRLQLLVGLANAVILRSESRGTYCHILLSQIRDSPSLECQVPVFISPRNRMSRLYPEALSSPFVASYDS